MAEDRAIFAGYQAAGIGGIVPGASNAPVILPADIAAYPMAFAQAANQLRSAGVDGPYTAVLSAEAYTAVSEASDHGYPVIRHLRRAALLDPCDGLADAQLLDAFLVRRDEAAFAELVSPTG